MRLSVLLDITVEVHGSRNSQIRGIGMNKMTASNRKRAIQTRLASITSKRPAIAIAALQATFLTPALFISIALAWPQDEADG